MLLKQDMEDFSFIWAKWLNIFKMSATEAKEADVSNNSIDFVFC